MLSRLKNYWDRFTGVEQRLLLILFFALAAGIGLTVWQNRAGGTRAPAVGGEYIEGLVGEVSHLNPLLSPASAADADITRVVFDGLYYFDQELNIVPNLAAEAPRLSPDGKEYTIKLRENVLWHDGQPFTADDVVYTLQAVQNPEYASPLRTSWTRVGIQKVDPLTVKLTTREASSTFVANLTLGILPKHLWESVPAESFALAKYNLEPVGTGPFRATELRRDRSGRVRGVTLRAFDRYFAGRPFLKKLTFKLYDTADELIDAFQAREIMGLGYEPFDRTLFLKPRNSVRQFALPLPQYQAVFINRAKNPAPLEDVRVRTALAKSVDKQKIIAEVYGGQASESYGPILPGHLGYHEQISGADMNLYDVEKAKTLLSEAGWVMDPAANFRRDKLGRIITLQLATNNFPPNARAAELLKEMWESVGVQIVLNIETAADLEEKYIRPRAYELLLHSQNVGADPDPYAFWHSRELRDPGANFSTFSNAQADKLLVEARGALPPEERVRRYRQFQEIFVGDVPAVFLTRSTYAYSISSEIKGISLGTIVTPAERFADIAKWYIETKRVK